MTAFDKALAALTNFGNEEYRRGYLDGLRVAEQCEAWIGGLLTNGETTPGQVQQWAETALLKAKKKLEEMGQ